MSSSEIMIEGTKLLANKWTNDEYLLIKRVLDNIMSYKSVIPKSIKKDIKDILCLSNHIKNEYEELKNLTEKQIKTQPLELNEFNDIVDKIETVHFSDFITEK